MIRWILPLSLPVAALGAGDAPTGTVVVSTRGNTNIVLFDAASGREVGRFDAGIGAHEIACSPDGRTAVGSAYGSGERHRTPDQRLFVIDLPGRRVERVIDLGAEHVRPNDLVFYLDGRHVLCTSEVKRSLIRVDVTEGRIAQEFPFGLPAGHMLAATTAVDRAFVPSVRDGKVAVIDLKTGASLATIDAAFGAEGVACSPDGKRVWVANNRSNSITVIDAEKLAASSTFAAEGFPFRVRFTPDGARVLIAFPQANEVRVFDAATNAVAGTVTMPGDGQGPGPTSIAAAPDSRHAAACVPSQETVVLIDAIDSRVITPMWAGPDPDGLAWSPLVLEAPADGSKPSG